MDAGLARRTKAMKTMTRGTLATSRVMMLGPLVVRITAIANQLVNHEQQRQQ